VRPAGWRCGAVGGEVNGEGRDGQGGMAMTRGEADGEEWPRCVFVKPAGGGTRLLGGGRRRGGAAAMRK
jgi:hypothetical protein